MFDPLEGQSGNTALDRPTRPLGAAQNVAVHRSRNGTVVTTFDFFAVGGGTAGPRPDTDDVVGSLAVLEEES